MLLGVLRGQKDELPALLKRYLDDFTHHRIDVKRFMKTETLQDSLGLYRSKRRGLAGKKRNPSAAYELALASERPYQPGDQVSYYVSGRGREVKVNLQAKLASEWNPLNPDENAEYYQGKLLELYEKFRPLLFAAEGRPPQIQTTLPLF